MDGTFTCPECGCAVDLKGLAPGRQVRCGFCRALLEVPYLPRAADPAWKRGRALGPRWKIWAWWATAALVVATTVGAGVQFARKEYRSIHRSAVQRLLASSRAHEAAGRLGQALVDLDAALDLARNAADFPGPELEAQRKRRGDLARREARATLKALAAREPRGFVLGDWLNLIARAEKGRDLQAIAPEIDDQFHRRVGARAELELSEARAGERAGTAVAALAACERAHQLAPHLPPDVAKRFRADARAVAERLVARHGVIAGPAEGAFLHGTRELYDARLGPIFARELAGKNYLLARPGSPWHDLWTAGARYSLRVEVTERPGGAYLGSENRISWIEVRLTLTDRGGQEVWKGIPTARTIVPVPGMPAYLATRLATSPGHSDEIEQRLYENARGQIEAKVLQTLSRMPDCP